MDAAKDDLGGGHIHTRLPAGGVVEDFVADQLILRPVINDAGIGPLPMQTQ